MIKTHRDRPCGPSGRREAVVDAFASSRLSDALRRAAWTTGTAAFQGFRTSSRTPCDAPHRRDARSWPTTLESRPYQPVEKGVIDRVSRHGEAYRGEGGFAILRDDEDDLNDQDGSSGRNKHEQGANSARHGLLRGAGADELAHQQR